MFYCRRSFFFFKKKTTKIREIKKKSEKKIQKNKKKIIREKCPAGRQNCPSGTLVHFNNFKFFVEKNLKIRRKFVENLKTQNTFVEFFHRALYFLPRKSKSTLYRPFQAQKCLMIFHKSCLGRVYTTRYSKWDSRPYGLVCTGERSYRIDQEFADFVCDDNGFTQAEFYGHRRKVLRKILKIFEKFETI